MAKDLTGLLKSQGERQKIARAGYELLLTEYDMDRVYPQVESLYGEVLLRKSLESFHEIPVLMYHRVSSREPSKSRHNLQISQAEMERHLLFLKNRGFATIGFEDLLTRKIPRKPIILTFDDGYEDNYRYLLPLLRKHRMKIVMFLLGNRKHKTNFWDEVEGEESAALLKPGQILEMARSGLVEFGAHSLNHLKLTELGTKDIEREVVGSKKALELFLKKPVLSFAYPYGFVNEKIKGFTFGIAVNTGPTRFGNDLLEIRRIHMFPGTSSFKYFKKTSGYYLRYRGVLGK
jgi:peptidoglycan/xylan/chitin deacetylase (PgdA/CDA1 family)